MGTWARSACRELFPDGSDIPGLAISIHDSTHELCRCRGLPVKQALPNGGVTLTGRKECIVPVGDAAWLANIRMIPDSQHATAILCWLVVCRHPDHEDLIVVAWSSYYDMEMCSWRAREKGIPRTHLI
jgi:hypothetical protein